MQIIIAARKDIIPADFTLYRCDFWTFSPFFRAVFLAVHELLSLFLVNSNKRT